METALEPAILKPVAADDGTAWKTEEYHGRQMHVCTEAQIPENLALAGHGTQWRFTVRVTGIGAGAADALAASATSDPDLFYSTQAIAEAMGFLRGRELIEATG